MKQPSALLSNTKDFLILTFEFYLLLYFVFLWDLPFDFVLSKYKYVAPVLHFIPIMLGRLLNGVFIHKKYNGEYDFGDTTWCVTVCIGLLFIAAVTALIIVATNKQRFIYRYFNFGQTLFRYVVALFLFTYGFDKVLDNQFLSPVTTPTMLNNQIWTLNHYKIFWFFMGMSKTYTMFGGWIEVVAGVLLLFRRTSTLGALVAIAVLTDVLVFNLGYGVFVKNALFHGVLFCLFILMNDFQWLFSTLVLRKNADLPVMQPVMPGNKRKWLRIALKCLVIGYPTVWILLD